MDEKLQQKLNEIMVLEESIQNKKNPHNRIRNKGSVLKRISNTLTRGHK
jgi:hypothetical protein